MRQSRIGFTRYVSFMRKTRIGILRTIETATLRLARRRWRIDRFNRLIESNVRETVRMLRNEGAKIIVGIPFHKESENLRALVSKLRQDLDLRREKAAIIIVGERKTRELLFHVPLPESSESVIVTRFTKPPGFGQRPGLSRRSWSHWAILQIAGQCRADVVFIDADVRNSEGWIHRYLDAIRDRGAMVVVADYVRQFAHDDAIVHVWDSLIFGALFRKWVAFRHGGDYALSGEFIPVVANDQTIMRERTYTMDSAVIARAVSIGARIETVWLGSKEHEPVLPENLFRRLPDLVGSVFEDFAEHLPTLLRLSKTQQTQFTAGSSPETLMMRDLIGAHFRAELHADTKKRFELQSIVIRKILGSTKFCAVEAAIQTTNPEKADLAPKLWAKATLRFLTRYIRRKDPAMRNELVNAYVPVLQIGVLGFLNHTFELTYEDAINHLMRDYLPAFQHIWNALARRLAVYRMAGLRKWPQALIARPFRL